MFLGNYVEEWVVKARYRIEEITDAHRVSFIRQYLHGRTYE